MAQGLRFTVGDDRVIVGHKMFVFMEPSMNVGPKDCALLLSVMDQIEASSQPCIAQQFVLPHVEAFSSTPLI